MLALTRTRVGGRFNALFNAKAFSTFNPPPLITPTTPEDKQVYLYSKKKQTSVSLKSLMESGRGDALDVHTPFKLQSNKASDKVVMQVACFLHRELPVRFSHRAVELENHPLLSRSPSIRNIAQWYKTSFMQIRDCPVPQDAEKEEVFARCIDRIYERHAYTLIAMAKGAHEIRTILNYDVEGFADYMDIQKTLDEFYMSRIGIRMLIGQYLALRKDSEDSDSIGLISLSASPYDIATQAIQDATYVCTRTHGDAPEVTIHGRTDLTFPYVSSHISYVLMELLKNSMRATVETHGVDKMPPVKIVIADGEDNEDVVIKVSDEGGGISRSNTERIWSYLYTTADPSVLNQVLQDDVAGFKDFDTNMPLAGLGYGLPISRNYARCFDGDLTIMSM
ncbi:branched-chain alpha-ketoacid dehydrogenase [Ochromonadaceae sp. CCMP2298]|nr:branched-chain alpha-ketoacid dehydrogenase [Ochromonadaceae sp. CCMP2298]